MKPTAGYSGTPLGKKLGLKEGFNLHIKNAPSHYWNLFDRLPDGIQEIEQPEEESIDFIHLFCTTIDELEGYAKECKPYLKKTGLLWVSWPKGASKIPTDLKREPIREYLLGLGLVDVKVAAIDADWSGLKFVYRLKDR